MYDTVHMIGCNIHIVVIVTDYVCCRTELHKVLIEDTHGCSFLPLIKHL